MDYQHLHLSDQRGRDIENASARYLLNLRSYYYRINTRLKFIKSFSSYSTATPEVLQEAFWRTLICNASLDFTRPGPEYFESYKAWYSAYENTSRLMAVGYWAMDFLNWWPVSKGTDFALSVCIFKKSLGLIEAFPGAKWFYWWYLIVFGILNFKVGKRLYGSLLRWIVILITTLLMEDRRVLIKRIKEAEKQSGLYCKALDRFSSGRRLCITQKGAIGWVHKSARVGDKIALFRASRIPFTLREVRGGYRLVCDCFLFGFMNHEIFGVEAAEDEEIVIM